MRRTVYRPYAGRRVGLLVVGALLLVVIALLQSSVIQDLVSPAKRLRVLLPASGVSGLAQGSGVEILGTPAGRVRDIVISPEQQFHAVVDIDNGMASYLRRDSQVVIKRQFGIAGAAYLEISRGKGLPLDWEYAVLTAYPERGASDNIGELIGELRARIFPVIDNANQTLVSVAAIAQGLRQGQGSAGRLLTDDALFTELTATAGEARQRAAEAADLIANLNVATGQISELGGQLGDPRAGVPALLQSVSVTLRSLQSTAAEVQKLTANAAGASDEMPQLLAQTQVTLRELQRLLVVLQSNWLIGGDAGPALGPRPGADKLWR